VKIWETKLGLGLQINFVGLARQAVDEFNIAPIVNIASPPTGPFPSLRLPPSHPAPPSASHRAATRAAPRPAHRAAGYRALPRADPASSPRVVDLRRHLQGRAERGAAAAGQATRAGAQQQGAKAGRQQGSGAAGLACKLDATGVSAGREASAHGDRPDLVA